MKQKTYRNLYVTLIYNKKIVERRNLWNNGWERQNMQPHFHNYIYVCVDTGYNDIYYERHMYI